MKLFISYKTDKIALVFIITSPSHPNLIFSYNGGSKIYSVYLILARCLLSLFIFSVSCRRIRESEEPHESSSNCHSVPHQLIHSKISLTILTGISPHFPQIIQLLTARELLSLSASNNEALYEK